jgi:hypothetical protein
VRSKQKSTPQIRQLRQPSNVLTDGDDEATGELCRFFRSVYETEEVSTLPKFEPDYINKPEDCIADVSVTLEEVLNGLTKLRDDKSMGPNEMHPKVLKEAASELAYPFMTLYQKSLSTGNLPQD